MLWRVAVPVLLVLASGAQGLFLFNPAVLQEDVGLTADCGHELVHVEEDGGACGDAPDECGLWEADRGPAIDGPTVTSTLKDGLDVFDHLTIHTASADVGDLVNVHVELVGLVPALDLWRVGVAVYTTDCSEDLTDPAATYYETHGPQVPPTPGGVEHAADLTLTADECGDEWRLVWNQQPQSTGRPGDALFEWTDGSSEIVAADHKGGGSTQYATRSHPDVTLASVKASGPADHFRHFMLVEGFCDALPGTPTAPYNQGLDAGFVPLTDGPFILALFIAQDTLETAGGMAVVSLDPSDPFRPWAVPASCHQDVCSAAAAQLPMLVGVSK